MNGFKNKLIRFMYGRYGMDQLSKFLSYIRLLLLIITIFVHNDILYFVALFGVFITYYRAFSRNISRRSAENHAYLKIYYKCLGSINRFKLRLKDNRTHKIFRCPSCSQKIRVPRKKGNISIKCPKCRIDFIRRT